MVILVSVHIKDQEFYMKVYERYMEVPYEILNSMQKNMTRLFIEPLIFLNKTKCEHFKYSSTWDLEVDRAETQKVNCGIFFLSFFLPFFFFLTVVYSILGSCAVVKINRQSHMHQHVYCIFGSCITRKKIVTMCGDGC